MLKGATRFVQRNLGLCPNQGELSPLYIYLLLINPQNHCFGVFEVCLWSEYAPTTHFHVGENKFTRHPIVWRAV